jgi:hypothetical protein
MAPPFCENRNVSAVHLRCGSALARRPAVATIFGRVRVNQLPWLHRPHMGDHVIRSAGRTTVRLAVPEGIHTLDRVGRLKEILHRRRKGRLATLGWGNLLVVVQPNPNRLLLSSSRRRSAVCAPSSSSP